MPDGRVMPSYYVMEFIDWVNVIALTPDHQMIMVEQYRHAAGETFLEVPGGSTDPGEEPLRSGQRELREETGYVSDEWLACGFHYPNPALQNNRMHTFLALNCRREGEPELDAFEDLVTVRMDVDEVFEHWLAGKIQHSIISASLALGYRELRRRGVLK